MGPDLTTTRARVAATFLLFAIAVGGFAFTMRITGPQLSWDGLDFAQIAREIVRGNGNTTRVLPWTLVEDAGRERWPNRLRSPLASHTIAALFRIAGSSDFAATLFSGTFCVGTVLMIFWVFAPVVGEAGAFLSALVFAMSRSGLVYARSGLTEPAAMFWMLVAIAPLVRLRARPLLAGALSGAGFGICALYRPVASVWLLGVILVLLMEGKERLRLITAMIIVWGALAILLPAMIGWQTGKAAIAINLAHRVGDSGEALRDPIRFILDHPAGMIRKTIIEFARPVVYLFDFGGVTLFSALGLFSLVLLRAENDEQRRIRKITLSMIAINAVLRC